VYAIIEGGFLMRDSLSVGNSVQEAARQGSLSGPEPDADYKILDRLERNLLMPTSDVRKVVVFRARTPTDAPDPACLSGVGTPAAGRECNVYGPSDFARPKSDFSCSGGGSGVDVGWCPKDRHDSGQSFDATDLLGVYVEVEHDYVTGFFGNSLTIERQSIVPLERVRS